MDHSTVDRMQAMVHAWEEANDRRAIFLDCYARMTRNMLAAVEAGDFEDSAWVSALLHHFAGYYFDALEAYERGQEGVAPVWRYAFEAARRPQTHVLQNLILGFNAHINYDLVFAEADMLAAEWPGLSAEGRQMRYRDHSRVNDIIYQTINGVQDQVVERYSPALDLVDKILGPLEEWVTVKIITEWREQVWEQATRLIELSAPDEREALLREVERRALERARLLLGEEGFSALLDLIT